MNNHFCTTLLTANMDKITSPEALGIYGYLMCNLQSANTPLTKKQCIELIMNQYKYTAKRSNFYVDYLLDLDVGLEEMIKKD